jgi:hypothetical protein
MTSNAKRVLGKVVSVEAWRTLFDSSSGTSTLHVDVSFLSAKLGEEIESPVRFEVWLKRAELVFLIPPNEPIGVIQSSVARENVAHGKKTTSLSSRMGEGFAASAGLGAGNSIKVAAGLAANIDNSSSSETSLAIDESITEHKIAQFRSDEGYCWEITPRTAKFLAGKVWNPVDEPRLQIKRKGESKIEPVCRVLLKCKREDIIIQNVEYKRELNLADRVRINRQAAAAAYIRNEISKAGLNSGDFNEILSDVVLADVMVDEELI